MTWRQPRFGLQNALRYVVCAVCVLVFLFVLRGPSGNGSGGGGVSGVGGGGGRVSILDGDAVDCIRTKEPGTAVDGGAVDECSLAACDKCVSYLFVGGHAYSGTTILGEILASHPCVATFSQTMMIEGQFIQSVFDKDKDHYGPLIYGMWKPPQMFLTEESKLVTEENKKKLFNDWNTFWDPRKPIKLEKSPPDLVKMRFLNAMFPENAAKRFIVSMKHPLTIFAGHKNMEARTKEWWIGQSGCSEGNGNCLLLDWFLTHYTILYETARNDAAHLAHVMCLKYESWTMDFASTLSRLMTFMNAADCVPVRVDESTFPNRTLYSYRNNKPVNNNGDWNRKLQFIHKSAATEKGEAVFSLDWRAEKAVRFAREWRIYINSDVDVAYLIDKHEATMKSFGYSIVDPTQISDNCGFGSV